MPRWHPNAPSLVLCFVPQCTPSCLLSNLLEWFADYNYTDAERALKFYAICIFFYATFSFFPSLWIYLWLAEICHPSAKQPGWRSSPLVTNVIIDAESALNLCVSSNKSKANFKGIKHLPHNEGQKIDCSGLSNKGSNETVKNKVRFKCPLRQMIHDINFV
jgi:hypothetical protein